MYYQNIETGKIIEIEEITVLYNIYGSVYVKNPDFDEDEEVSDENPEFILYENDEDFLVDEQGRLIDTQIFSHGVSQVWFDRDWYDEDGNLIEDFSGYHIDSNIETYWDGHNFRARVLYSENGYADYKEVENFDPGELIHEGSWHNGTCTNIHYNEETNTFFRYVMSQWAGSVNYHEEIEVIVENEINANDEFVKKSIMKAFTETGDILEVVFILESGIYVGNDFLCEIDDIEI